MGIIKDSKFLELGDLFREISKKYDLTYEEIYNNILDYNIPINIFSTDLSAFEIICKYLIENKNLKYTEIANLTNRSRQGIYLTYKNASRKFPEKFNPKSSKYNLPMHIFRSKYSILESIVKYLHETFKLSFSDISRLVNRDPRTIWTVYHRVKNK